MTSKKAAVLPLVELVREFFESTEGFHARYMEPESEARFDLVAISEDEVQNLQKMLSTLSSVLPVVKAEKQKADAETALEDLAQNPEILKLLKAKGFESLEDMLEVARPPVVMEVEPEPATRATAGTTKSNNKEYTVTWNEDDKTTNKRVQKVHTVFNGKPTAKLAKEKFFIDWMKNNNDDIHEFMLMYSEDYKNHCRNEYKGKRFYLNKQGKPNKQFDEAFSIWKDERKAKGIDDSNTDIKELKEIFDSETIIKGI